MGYIESDPPEEAAALRTFLDHQQAFQAKLLADLRMDPHSARWATPEVVEANRRRLVAVWDALSLAICSGLRAARQIGGVPTVDGEIPLTVIPIAETPAHLTMDPWPFAAAAVTVSFEGRRLPEPGTDERTMQAELAQAPWVTFEVHLHPPPEAAPPETRKDE